MVCPVCQARLVEEAVLGIHVDRCIGCQGVWFDAGEVEAYRAGANLRSGRSAVPQDPFVPAPDLERERCPRCGSDTLEVGRLGSHALRRCSRCSGVFVTRRTIDAFEPGGAMRAAGDVAGEAVGHGVGEALVEVVGWIVGSLFEGL